MIWRLCGLLVLVAGVCLAARPARPEPAEIIVARATPSAPAREAHPGGLRGVGSCSAAACHGSAAPAGLKGSEYTTWATLDRHARAYSVLFSPRSERIAKRYRGRADARAETDRLCLRCHDPLDSPAEEASPLPTRMIGEGVGCESCHGPADRWLGLHNSYTWKALNAEARASLGFRPTKDLLARSQSCVPCHVGAPGGEVNHALIAAGHPRLNFELSAFLAVMPRHWNEADDKARYPDLEARAWAIGQVASARAALDLLAARADSAAHGEGPAALAAQAPWPEFAEYSCYACHHDLAATPRPGARGGSRSVGTPEWGSWYLPLLPALGDSQHQALPPSSQETIAALRHLMGQPLPPAAQVARQARAAARDLEAPLRAIAARPLSAEDVRRLFASIAREGQDAHAPGWDRDAQRYLALAALYHAEGDLDPARRDPALRPAIDAMNQALRFPPTFDSPRGYLPEAFENALRTARARLDR